MPLARHSLPEPRGLVPVLQALRRALGSPLVLALLLPEVPLVLALLLPEVPLVLALLPPEVRRVLVSLLPEVPLHLRPA